MSQLQLVTAQDWADANFAPSGTFAGANFGTGSGVGYEPLHYKNSEASTSPLIGWLRPFGNSNLLVGDGAGTPPAQIMLEGSFRLNAPPVPPGDANLVQFLWHIGHNGAVPFPKGLFGCYVGQSGGLVVQVGTDFGNLTSIRFNSNHAVMTALNNGAFHRIRCEYEEDGSIPNQFNSNNINFYLDEVLQVPDVSGGAANGYWDDSVDQQIAFGGTDNNNSGSFSFGNILISTDANAVFNPNTNPAGTINSITLVT